MLEIVEKISQSIIEYISDDKRYVYVVMIQQKPHEVFKTVFVTIYDKKFDITNVNNQPQSFMQYLCKSYSVENMIKRCQYLFNDTGLYRNNILTYLDYYELQSKSYCPAQE